MAVTSLIFRQVDKGAIGGRVKSGLLASIWPLTLILAMQAVISVATLHNTAFQDEALYLYAGRQLFHYYFMGGPVPLDHYAFYFSGYPGVYPLLGGMLDMIGGLQLARTFSLFCMLGVNTIIYYLTGKHFQRPAAILASAGYASLGTVLFVGQLATFDALCLFLIALAALAAFRVSASRHPWLALLIGPLLVLSVLAKYAAMLFALPVLGILVFSTIMNLGWWRMLLRLVMALATLALSLFVTYKVVDKAAFHAIVGSTTDRTALIQKSHLELLLHVMYMGGIVYAAAFLGLVLVFFHQRRLFLVALLLFGSSWLVPAYHIYKQEAVSLDKHLSFGLFFAMPLAGYAFAWLSGYTLRAFSNFYGRYWLAGLSVILLIFTLGMQQSQTIYAGWANTSALSYVLHTQMRDGSGRFLVEDIEVARYDAKDVSEQWQWNGVNYFYYVNSAHKALLGDEALREAIQDRYFALIELSFNYQPYEAHFIEQQMLLTRNYDLIARVQFQNSYGIGHFYIFRSAPVAGHGDFISRSQVLPEG